MPSSGRTANSFLRARYSIGHIDRLPPDVVNTFADLDRVQAEWFDDRAQARRAGSSRRQSPRHGAKRARVFHEEMQVMLRRGLPVCDPCEPDAAEFRRRGGL